MPGPFWKNDVQGNKTKQKTGADTRGFDIRSYGPPRIPPLGESGGILSEVFSELGFSDMGFPAF